MECLTFVILIFSAIFALAILATLIAFIFSRRSACLFSDRDSPSRIPMENPYHTHRLAPDSSPQRSHITILDFATHTSHELNRGGSFKKEVHPITYGTHKYGTHSVDSKLEFEIHSPRTKYVVQEQSKSLSGSLDDSSSDGSNKTEVYIDPSAERFNKPY